MLLKNRQGDLASIIIKGRNITKMWPYALSTEKNVQSLTTQLL